MKILLQLVGGALMVLSVLAALIICVQANAAANDYSLVLHDYNTALARALYTQAAVVGISGVLSGLAFWALGGIVALLEWVLEVAQEARDAALKAQAKPESHAG